VLRADEPETQGGYMLPQGRYVGPAEDPDRYELLGDGLRGGEGTTWRARYHGQLMSPLTLAVKQLYSPSAADRRRRLDQAALLRHLRAAHIVQVHEVFFGAPIHPPGGAIDGEPQDAYLVMEWVDGPTLRQLCHGHPATGESVVRRMGYVQQAAVALSELSSNTRSAGNPSLHRDVKPGNCIIHEERGLVLIDVSTVRLVADGVDEAGWHTPEYTAPEVAADPSLPRSRAADAYSLGGLAVFCLTGQDPVPGLDPAEGLRAAARTAGVAALRPDPARERDPAR